RQELEGLEGAAASCFCVIKGEKMRKEARYAVVIAAAVIIALSLWVWWPWAGPGLTDYQAVIVAQCWTGYEMHGHDVSNSWSIRGVSDHQATVGVQPLLSPATTE